MKILLHTVIIVVKYKVRCKLRIPITISFIQNCIEVLSNFPEREKNTKIKKNCSYFKFPFKSEFSIAMSAFGALCWSNKP